MAKAKTRKPKTPKVEWQPNGSVCEPLAVSESIATPDDSPSDCPCCNEGYEDPTDVNPCTPSDHVYETKGDSPAVVTRGDIAKMTLDYVLPTAAAMCEEGQLRERMLERDPKHADTNTYWMVEVARDTWETTSRLPHNMPPLRFEGRPTQAPWEFCLHLQRWRVARGEMARKIARESTFLVAGRGVQT